MNFFKHLFEIVSFTRSLPNTVIQRSRTLEGGVKEPIIQIPRNFWVPYTVQFIDLFGYIWLLNKFVSSAVLANSSSVKTKCSWKIDRGYYRPSEFVLAISYFPWIWRQFSKIIFPPQYTFIFWGMVFCVFQMFLLYYMIPVMCLELQIRHSRCLPLSSGTWSLFYKFIVCKHLKFCFLMANFCCSFFHYFFFFNFRIIYRILLRLRNKSFIVYCRVLITLMKVQDFVWCNSFFTWSFVNENETVHISP